jgi:flagellin
MGPSFNPGLGLRTLNAFRAHSLDLNRAMERLATGRKLNRASDDPAGSITADRLTSDIRTVESTITRNTRELGFLAAKEGAHGAVGDLLQDLQGIVVTAANRGGMSAEEIDALQTEANAIIGSINYLANNQEFNGNKLLDEAHAHKLGHVTLTTKNADGTDTVTHESLMSVANAGKLNLKTGNLETAQKAIEAAISDVATTRGVIGARQQDLESQIRVGQSELENLSAARSQIVDADYAVEVSNMIRTQTLQQASMYMMQVMMQSGQQVLGLLSNVVKR